jgi:ATP-dependent helicase Lhr and Lhr-like helicase
MMPPLDTQHQAHIVQTATSWFHQQGWQPFPFQQKAWKAFATMHSGLINAPTGSGKTYSLLLPAILEGWTHGHSGNLRVLWITPIRALGKEIAQSAQNALQGLDIPWQVGIRTGDTQQKTKQQQLRRMPEILITTPESLHLLFATKNHQKFFKDLHAIVVDEWHELLGSKRGVQMELALARLRQMNPKLLTWGISATIGNIDEAMQTLLGPHEAPHGLLIRADLQSPTEVHTIFPDTIETLPWAGHLGIRLLEKVVPIIHNSRSTLIFTNTRAQAEIWYQKLLEADEGLAGLMAMHHGSISRDLRSWVEDALYDGRLKAVVCTSSLDLGVDFRPVETIIQVGSPKGVSRFMQRAGRSGHRPGAVSKIYFLPTHSLELIEAAALREALEHRMAEARYPYLLAYDVLIQWLVTLAVSDGFNPQVALLAIRSTSCFQAITDSDWQWCLDFITHGGQSLQAYPDFHKVVVDEEGTYRVVHRRIALRHRLHIGTIVSDAMLRVKLERGGHLGTIEEWFVSKLKPGDVFWFAGQALEFVRIRELTVVAKRSKSKKGIVPSWMGGRMPLSAQLGELLRKHLHMASLGNTTIPEHKALQPLLDLQKARSIVPDAQTFLIEYLVSGEGHHLFCYPFEGRFVHEGLAALLAWRLSLFQPITFTIAMNDYGFELLSDAEIPIQEALDSDVFTVRDLMADILRSVNETEMARRRFRDIAAIGGLLFTGYPGKPVKERNLQSSSSLMFEVFNTYDPENLLLRQARQEVMDHQLEESRLRMALERIQSQQIVVKHIEKPTPFAFPILVDRLREHVSSETLEQRIQKMTKWST